MSALEAATISLGFFGQISVRPRPVPQNQERASAISCSGGVDAGLFQKIVAGAALDAGVEALIVARLGQGIDHPVALNFPEGAYLKGLIIRVKE